ncbi:hypothetical protein EV360DRAFT_73411 [Lentinula raphanica]|nr:hypothetical protein EV360DRAFT_73411 [Lentinula raphanica]
MDINSIVRFRTRTEDIKKIDSQILKLYQEGLVGKVFKAIVVGTHCDGPHLVNVGVDINISMFSAVEDLNVHAYLWKSKEPGIICCANTTVHVNHLLDNALTKLDQPYMFFFESPRSMSLTNNVVADNAIVDDDVDIPVIWGNVLVIKHDAGAEPVISSVFIVSDCRFESGSIADSAGGPDGSIRRWQPEGGPDQGLVVANVGTDIAHFAMVNGPSEHDLVIIFLGWIWGDLTSRRLARATRRYPDTYRWKITGEAVGGSLRQWQEHH